MKIMLNFGLAMATATLLFSHPPALLAQDANNILGLPAVPQNPAPAASGAKKPATPVTAAKPTEADIKSALSGNLRLASFYPEGLIIVRVATDKTFVGNAARTHARTHAAE